MSSNQPHEDTMNRRQTNQRGFTLIELLITVTILGILSAIVLPQYQEYIARTRRVDVASSLMDASQYMQKLYDANRSYFVNNAAPQLPVSMRTSPANSTGSKVMYNISVTTPTANTYLLTATPNSSGAMASNECGSFTIDQRGRRAVINSYGKTVADCWR